MPRDSSPWRPEAERGTLRPRNVPFEGDLGGLSADGDFGGPVAGHSRPRRDTPDGGRELDEQRKLIDREKMELYRQMLARLAGNAVEKIVSQQYCEPYEVATAVNRRALVHRREILAATDVGRQVLELEREKEELLDTDRNRIVHPKICPRLLSLNLNYDGSGSTRLRDFSSNIPNGNNVKP